MNDETLPGPFDPGAIDPGGEASDPREPRPGTGAWPDERPRVQGRWVGAVMAFVQIFVVGVCMVCVAGTIGVGLVLLRLGFDPERLMTFSPDDVDGWFLFWTYWPQFLVTVGVGLALAVLVGWRARHALALRSPGVASMIIAVVGGLLVGLPSSWIAERLMELMPQLANRGALELISRVLMADSLWERAAVISTVCVAAPVLEELLFRGLLWNAMERVLPGRWGQIAALVVTSLGFMAMHADPIQSPALVLTAFFLGWLRLTSGSIWPGVLAHFLNNTLAATFSYVALTTEVDLETTPLWLAIVGLVAAIVLSALAVLLRRRPAATPESAWAALRS